MKKVKKTDKKVKHKLVSKELGAKKAKSKATRSEIVNKCTLYEEDIGMEGIKQSGGPILSGPESFKFKVMVNDEEQRRRLKRKARFGCGVDYRDLATSDLEDAEPDGLSMALSSHRSGHGEQSCKTIGRGDQAYKKIGKNKITREGRFVGTNRDLEKNYLRLTTYPKPEQVRPQEVLIRSLAHIKSRYFKNEDFEWANEQLKSVRQDIIVQRLRNKFVLEVYETHARILLEHGDLSEFNQCQTVIRYLTTTGLELADPQIDLVGCDGISNGASDSDEGGTLSQSDESADEFRAYALLYSLIQNSRYDLTRSLMDTSSCNIAEEYNCQAASLGRTSSTRHAFRVVKAVLHDDYRTFFRLYESAPHMSAYLMDFLVKQMREKAFERIIAAYRPTISVEYFREALCFQDLEESRRFLRKCGAVFVVENGEPPFWIDCKASKYT